MVDGLTPEDKEWVKEAINNPSLAFASLARVVAEKWLTNSADNLISCFLSVHAAIELEKGTPVKESLDLKPTAEEILQVAEWAGLEKNNEWHRVVAMTMRECGLHDDALKQFAEALKLERNQMVLQGIAKTYVLKQDWKKAIDCDNACKKLLEEELETVRNSGDQETAIKLDLHELLGRMAQCFLKMGDNEKAAEYYKAGYGMNPECFVCPHLYINLLDFSNRHVEVMDFIKEMHTESSGKENSGFVGFCLSDYPPRAFPIALAARKTNEQRFLANAYRDATIAAASALQAVRARELEARLAKVYYTGLWEDDQAIHIWQRLNLMAGSSAKQESVMAQVRKEARTNLSQAYLTRALSEPKGSPKQEAAVNALERLALIKKNTTSRKKDLITANPASLVLGRWYRLEGRTEEANACFRANVKMALQILGDDDPNNDIDGYETLFYILVACEKDTEATGVFNVLALVWSGWVQGSKGDDRDMTKEGEKNEKDEKDEKDEEDEKDETKSHATESNTLQGEEGRNEKRDTASNDGITSNKIDGPQEGSTDTKKNDKVSNEEKVNSHEKPYGLTSQC
jgi:tetratricopeptide (TPR) repeat protein